MAGLGGRRTHRTPENRESILRLLRNGNTREDSAKYTGFDVRTLERWMSADVGLRRDVEQAEAAARIRAVTIVADSAFGRPAQHDDTGRVIRAEIKPNVAAAMWYLERRDPLNWGRRVSVSVERIIERYAEEAGLDRDEIMAEVERLYAENAETFRRT